MKQPPWTSKEGDPRFWNARGVVQHFLSELYDLSLAPLRLKRQTALGFNQRASLEHLYLYLPNRDGLEALYNIYGSQQAFFNALESTYMSSIISEVRTLIRIRNLDRPLTFQDLSEGEQQLLMVLGLLRFTKEDEALFLLDEPDTHLNPIWSIQYLELMKEVVGEQKSSHVIMSTHNPLVVASLEVPQIKIMQREEETGRVTAEPPEESPRGMGIDGILTSDLFGLRSALDPPTQDMVDTRRELAVKDELSVDEHEKLEKLNKQLGEIDFSINARDNLYLRFVKEMTKRDLTGIRRQIELTPQQRRDQRKLILEILEELSQEERGDEAY
jgi:ABC-type multidrug transport system ATPase subunit